MTTETTTETTTQTPATETREMTFHEYVDARREGKPIEPVAKSETVEAPVEKEETAKEETEPKADKATESEGDEHEETEAQAEGKPKKKSGAQRQREWKARAEAEIEYWKQQALKGASATETPKAETAPKATQDGKPNPNSFETHAEYVEALADWKIEQREKAREEKEAQAKQEAERAKLVTTYAEKAKAFAEAHDDFDDVIAEADEIKAPPAVLQAIVESENGPALAYELAKNKAEYKRICALSPIAAAREIGRIEARLTASTEKKPETKTVTTAPKPLAPTGKGPAKVAKSIADPDLSFQDYVRLRSEQMKRRA